MTYATLGSSPYWSWGYEQGINEHGVAVGNEAIWTKVLVKEIASDKAGKGPKLGPTGMDLVRLALERGRTARESLDAVTAVVEKYGQFGSATPTRGLSGAYHNSFIIADAGEAWVLETAGTNWVAKRLRNGSTSISNGVSLDTDFQLASAQVVRHAVARGWWPEGKVREFHFQHAYSKNTPIGGAVATRVHPRAQCSRRLLQEKSGEIDPRWMMHIARSPPIDQNATASSSVAVLPKGDERLPVVRKEFEALEKEFEAGIPGVVDTAVRLRKSGKTQQAAGVLDAYTTKCLDKVLLKLNQLRTGFADKAAVP